MRTIITFLALFSISSFGATSPETQKYLVSLLKVNDGVHSAFIKNDEQGFKSVWENFEKTLLKSPPAELKEFINESKLASSNLFAAEKFDEKRKLYGDVMKPIVAMLQKYGPIESYKVFTCPMVKKDWIQDVKVVSKVQNPYAPQMVNCGMMRE